MFHLQQVSHRSRVRVMMLSGGYGGSYGELSHCNGNYAVAPAINAATDCVVGGTPMHFRGWHHANAKQISRDSAFLGRFEKQVKSFKPHVFVCETMVLSNGGADDGVLFYLSATVLSTMQRVCRENDCFFGT
jgi:hypothetical protein